MKQKQSSEIDLHIHGQLIFDRNDNVIKEKEYSFQQMVFEQLNISMQKNEPQPHTQN